MHIPARLTGPGARRTGRVTAVIVVALIGGTLGLLLGGRVHTAAGPTEVELSLRPSLGGGTTVQIPPLGALDFDTHAGPIGLRAQVTELRLEPARRLIDDPKAVDDLADTVAGEVRHGMIVMLLRGIGLALVLGFAAGLVVFRSWRRALLGTAAPVAGLAVLSLLGWLTFDPRSLAEPRYTGLLANAPQVVGDTHNIVDRFSHYRENLARLVGNMSRLYAATSTLPTYEPDPSTVRVLHVSDIHLNPAAWNVIRSVSTQFRVNMIVDTGDLMDHGTSAENKFADDIKTLKVPYVYIRGNHDSGSTQRAVRRQKNAIVLDDDMRTVNGLTIYGVGDPRFTPDKSTKDDTFPVSRLQSIGSGLAGQLAKSGRRPDIVMTHDPTEGERFSGLSPLLLAGHTHARSTRLLPSGSRLFIQGSTGGAGLRSLDHSEPTPIELSVLYFNRTTHRLQGWDDLRLGGLGLTSAQIERHLEPAPDREIRLQPVPASPSPSSPTPSSPTPATTRPSSGG
ncbi:cyclic 3',5'-adenosine monophosphate phosphodiesterase [Actinomadura rubteroloni]|uniref:Cyclic 3',5'-adenosine monophosphate phosphodiesterase n=1 Tax=Actinomadura rubteroloni TaxID=1926885 RepID=A0A2P4UNY3_9ACTN|nr:metallophosphoesterase [Actinomadura rubteroloni]POM26754.1 cyclic 3',5'-adenosine monophosphate phosphodiesterase [Actinomadura rubteroloni]